MTTSKIRHFNFALLHFLEHLKTLSAFNLAKQCLCLCLARIKNENPDLFLLTPSWIFDSSINQSHKFDAIQNKYKEAILATKQDEGSDTKFPNEDDEQNHCSDTA